MSARLEDYADYDASIDTVSVCSDAVLRPGPQAFADYLAFLCWARGALEPGVTDAQRAFVLISRIGYRRIEAGPVLYLTIARLLDGASDRSARRSARRAALSTRLAAAHVEHCRNSLHRDL